MVSNILQSGSLIVEPPGDIKIGVLKTTIRMRISYYIFACEQATIHMRTSCYSHANKLLFAFEQVTICISK